MPTADAAYFLRLYLRIAAASVVHGHLAIDKPLDGGVAVHTVLLAEIGLLCGIDLQRCRHESSTAR